MRAQAAAANQHCLACLSEIEEFLPGPAGVRPHACCPHCQSLERHRFLALLLDALVPLVESARLVVDVAPQSQIRTLLQDKVSGDYVSLDREDRLHPSGIADLTRLPLRTDSVDLLLSYHVLEHIPEDRQAMREIARVINNIGLALIQVPYNPNSETEEDPAAPPSERTRRFGQEDHVRLYGNDFERRLFAEGLIPTVVWPGLLLPEDQLERFGLISDERVWLCRSMRSAGQPPQRLADLERELAAVTSRYEALRHHPLISAGITLTRPFRRLIKRLRQT